MCWGHSLLEGKSGDAISERTDLVRVEPQDWRCDGEKSQRLPITPCDMARVHDEANDESVASAQVESPAFWRCQGCEMTTKYNDSCIVELAWVYETMAELGKEDFPSP